MGFVASILPRSLAPRRDRRVYARSLVFAVQTIDSMKRGPVPGSAEISVSFRLNSLPEAWQNVLLPLRDAAEADLRAGESILAWLEPDLDVRLRFARGLVVLTDQRVLSFEMEAEEGVPGRGTAAVRSRQWPLEPQSILRTRDEGGAGTLELLNESGRVVYWRFTAGRASAAHRLVDRLKAFREGVAIADEGEGGSAESLCRGCGLPVPPDVPLCVACAAAAATRPAQSLFRLAPFARARAGMLLLGFFLSVASTAASLISIYLIRPIYDTILTPYEEGKADNFHLIGWYLLGMAVAAILAWLLGWAQTTCWRGSASGWPPTCATPPTPICSDFRWSSSAGSGPAT